MTINRGILSQRRKRIVLPLQPEVVQVPLWKAILICVALVSMASSYAYSLQPDNPTVVKKVPVIKEVQVSSCDPYTKIVGKEKYLVFANELTGAMPASAFLRGRK